MRVLYFAWLRERIGAGEEAIDPGDARTPSDLIARLVASDDRYAHAFEDTASVRVAIDQKMADLDTPLGDAAEVAFFPPVTGG